MIVSIFQKHKVISSLLGVMMIFQGFGQTNQALPGNGKYASSAPQGAARYQRQFYLIDSTELAKAGIQPNTNLESIGFRYGVAQDIKTKGNLKVYLQNTPDRFSRYDTTWTTVSNLSSVYRMSSLSTGEYEWQVVTNCSAVKQYSSIAVFRISEDTCKSPTHLITRNITDSSAKFTWLKPVKEVGSFKVEYAEVDKSIWHVATTTNDYFDVKGLLPNKVYKWRVTAVCAGTSSTEMGVFTTDAITGSCAALAGLSATGVKDSSATLSWTAAQNATQYDVWFKRVGAKNWNQLPAFSASTLVTSLEPGTQYEWKVRTICGAGGAGSFTYGTSFTTTGTSPCYASESLYADSSTASTIKLSWDTVAGISSYSIRYRKRQSISWTNATSPMTLVIDSIVNIPDTTGVFNIPFNKVATNNYTGKGLYVAFEYQNAVETLSTRNVSFANFQQRYLKDANGEDSAMVLLGFGELSATSLPPSLSSSLFRPETWFGAKSFKDNAAVLAVYAMGHNAIPFGNPSKISTVIKNYTNGQQSYVVSLVIKDKGNQQKHQEQKTISVNADTTLTVDFETWSPNVLSTDSIIVSIPVQTNETVTGNNRGFYLQQVNTSLLGYDDCSDAISSTGRETVAGLTLARYTMSGCGSISAAQVFLHYSAAGHPVYAVVLNSSKQIVATSDTITPDSSSANKYHSFYFKQPVAVANAADFYIGLGQPNVSMPFAPVGVQWESGYSRRNAYYTSNADGTGLTEDSTSGRMMILAEIIPAGITPVINGKTILCPSGSATLSAGSITYQYANRVITTSSNSGDEAFSAAQVLGAPNVYPAYEQNPRAWSINSPAEARDFVEVGFATASNINYVDIFETTNAGAIDTVYVRNAATGVYVKVYQGTANISQDVRAVRNRVNLPLTSFKVDAVRIALNSSLGGNNGIDAVSIGVNDSVPAFSSYSWSLKTNSGLTSLGSTNTISASQAGTYILTVVSGGCTLTATTIVEAQDQTAPVITASGALTICEGNTLILTSDKTTGNLWSNGATTNAIVAGGGSYTVSYNDGSGCTPVSSSPVVITENKLPVITITGKTGICLDSTTTLKASASGTYTYLWSNASVGETAVIASEGIISVTATDQIGCNATKDTTTFLVDKPVPKISGRPGFCSNGSTSLNAGNGFATYAWSNGGANETSVYSTAGKSYVTVKNEYGCSGSDTLQIVQYTDPTPKITGSLSLCGGPTVISVEGNYPNITWSTSETSQAIKVTERGTYTVTVIDANGCSGNTSATTLKDSLPPPPGPITSPGTNICSSPGATYFVDPIPEASYYVWSVPEHASIVSGQGGTSVVIAFNSNFRSGEIVVAASNACGQNGSLFPRTLPINVTPATPGKIMGATNGVCTGNSIYTIQPSAGATSYKWTLPMGATLISGQGTTSITVSFTSSFKTGSICVKAENACATSGEQCITVMGAPAAPSQIDGLRTVCNKQAGVKYTTPVVEGATSYTWTVPAQATVMSGQGTNSILVKFGTSSGVIAVNARNSCGVSLQKSIDVINSNCKNGGRESGYVNLVPEIRIQDVIASAGNVSIVGQIQFDWTMGEPLIENFASAKNYYTQGFHQPLIIVKQTPIIVKSRVTVIAAPNPVSSKVKIFIEATKEEHAILNIRDARGVVVFTRNLLIPISGYEIDMSSFASGMYYVNVRNVDGNINENVAIVKAGFTGK